LSYGSNRIKKIIEIKLFRRQQNFIKNMSLLRSPFIPPSSELIALCQSQLALLAQGLKADWSAVYLAQEIVESADTHLIPIAVHPQKDAVWEQERAQFLPEVWHRVTSSAPLLLRSSSSEIAQKFDEEEIEAVRALSEVSSAQGQHQMVFPLLDEDTVMGLLVTGRKERNWNRKELSQIEKIAKTIGLACLLDRRKGWYQKQLDKQYRVRRWERDRIDSLLHQLRNPLTALRTFGKLLLKRLLPGERNQSIIEGIIRESDRLQELLQTFEANLDVEETATEAVTLDANARLLPPASTSEDEPSLLLGEGFKLEPVSVETVLEPLFVSAAAIAQEKNIELSIELLDRLSPVKANAQALREVLSNLIDNAIKYTPAGGKVLVRAGLQRANEQNWLGIAVEDTGCGIPLEDRSRLFKRHYRGVQARGDIPGTGLGLALVKELVEQMQGEIELISPNQMSQKESLPGTSFIVWLNILVDRD
jgi:signal transduction histidine kinase